MAPDTAEQGSPIDYDRSLDHIRSGETLDTLDRTDYYERLDQVIESHGDAICDPTVRTEFIDLIQAQSRGPVVELVRLTFVDGEFVLERAWYYPSHTVGSPDTPSRGLPPRSIDRRSW